MTLALTDVELAAVTTVWAATERELSAAFSGVSMLPTIAPGQRVLLRCGTEPAVGDVAAYVLKDQVVVHRLVARSAEKSWFLAWGDANALPDPPFVREKLIGTVAAIEIDGRLVDVPAAGRSLRRAAILRLIASPPAALSSVERRVRLLYRVRDNLALPLPTLVSKVVKRLVRRPA